MPEHVLSQVEDAIAAILAAYPALSGHSVAVLESVDVAIENAELPCLAIYTANYGFDVADENWMNVHDAEIHVEAISAGPVSTGTIARANRNALAHVIAAVAADRTLGLGIQDIQESDMAPVEPRGKDTSAALIKFNVKWFTPLGDHFTIS